MTRKNAGNVRKCTNNRFPHKRQSFMGVQAFGTMYNYEYIIGAIVLYLVFVATVIVGV